MGKVKEVKKQCCKKYRKKGCMCSRCPLFVQEDASEKTLEKKKKKDKKKKKKTGKKK